MIMITCEKTLILSLFALAGEAQEDWGESEELAALSWLAGDPWRDTVSGRDEDIERQCAGFKAWQLILCPVFSTTLRLYIQGHIED